jgi:spore germination cell wall hydrolase CwlJ-like protein
MPSRLIETVRQSSRPERAAILLAVLLAVSIVIGGFVLLDQSRSPGEAGIRSGGAAPPPVEPLLLKQVSPETAREINAAVPFAKVANPPAKPFRLDPTGPAFARAVDCLAAAAYYEAGDDAEGQRSVVQVVLNRVRHPAFPKSVCGVVFQGSERATGCQFTFTCDGALARTPSAVAWQRARDGAQQALTGRVYGEVGVATHYHTDWVVPYWSASMVKLTAVKTHLFFRWAGGWGLPSALRGGYGGTEPAIARMASLSPAHAGGEDGEALAAAGLDPVIGTTFSLAGSAFQKILFRSDEDFLVLLRPGVPQDSMAASARLLCGDRTYCAVRGWTDAGAAPGELPVSDQARTAMGFSYRRDTAQSFDKPLWNCKQFDRANPRECMKESIRLERVSLVPALSAIPAGEPQARTAPKATPPVVETNAGRRRPGQSP